MSKLNRPLPLLAATLSLLALAAAEPAHADERGAKAAAKSPARLPRFVTFNQEQWGEGEDRDPRVAKLLAERFAEAFEEGLKIGEEGKGRFQVKFANGEAVAKFLPNRGAPGPLSADGREGAEDAGGLAGELIAARLNQRFNRLGMLGNAAAETQKDLALKDLVFRGGVAKDLVGRSLEDVLKLADRALAGEFGKARDPRQKRIDAGGDGEPDVSYQDLRNALHVANQNFREGRDDGRLVRPGKGAPKPIEEESEVDDSETSPEVEKAAAQRDRELEQAEDEFDRELDQARLEARKAGKPEQFAAKRVELERKLAAKRAEINARYDAKRLEIRSKWERKHPNHPGLGPTDGRGQGRDKDKGRDKDDKDGGKKRDDDR